MATSLETKYLSGGFSIQRNEMVSIPQQLHRQRFQFINSFNQTFAKLDRPAQGLGKDADKQIDRIPAYFVRSEERKLVQGKITTITKPLAHTYSPIEEHKKCSFGDVFLGDDGNIETVMVTNSGLGYAPSTRFNLSVRGGAPNGTIDNTVFFPATVHGISDGLGRITRVEVVDGGVGYTLDSTVLAAGAPLTIELDESPLEGQFSVTRFNGLKQTGVVGTGTNDNPQIPPGVGAITAISMTSGRTGQRPGVWFVSHKPNAASIDQLVLTSANGKLDGFSCQVYVGTDNVVSKVVLFGYGEAFEAGDTIDIPQGLLGGSKPSNTWQNANSEQYLRITIDSVATVEDLRIDHGAAHWRSESFTAGQDVVMEYHIDNSVDTHIADGALRTLARDLTLHPYANYYTSAWSTVHQRNSVLNFSGALSTGLVTTETGDIIATLTSNDPPYATLDHTQAFQIHDVGKRIIEPFGNGSIIITDVGNDDGSGGSLDHRASNGVTAGAAICSIDSLVGTSNERSNMLVANFDNVYQFIYPTGKWKLAIKTDKYVSTYDGVAANISVNNFPGMVKNEGGFESQPYNLIYPRLTKDHTDSVSIDSYGQQNHKEVMQALRRIGDMFVVESEKATDILSSKNDVSPSTSSIPSTISLTAPIKDSRKPQKWRMRFYYDSRDEYLYVNVATSLQILDNGDMTTGQGRDGIKAAVYRQPGELSEIYYNFKSETNKAKSGFFRRQGKTEGPIEPSYPMAYRLSCTDHGTGFFIYDQASVDQDDDYAWFVVQRHVNNVSGRVEAEDGKSPVHCLYAPSKRPEETSDYNVGFFASISTETNPDTGEDIVTSKKLSDSEIYDVNGRKLRPGIPLDSTIVTAATALKSRPTSYGSGRGYQKTPEDSTGTAQGHVLTDEYGLGMDQQTGYSTVNDFFVFPPLDISTDAGKDWSKHNYKNTTQISSRDGFSVLYPQSIVSGHFAPVGDYISDATHATGATYRYTASTDSGSSTEWTKLQTAHRSGEPGIKNFVTARNQMQGPTRLGLKIARVRHRTPEGVDTFLDADKDFTFLYRADVEPRKSDNGVNRELPIVASTLAFNPTSSAAKKLVLERRHRHILYEQASYKFTFATGKTVREDRLADTSTPLNNGDATTMIWGHATLNPAAMNVIMGEILEDADDTATPVLKPFTPDERHIRPVPGMGSLGGNTVGFYAQQSITAPSAGIGELGSFVTGSGVRNNVIPVDMKVGDNLTFQGIIDAEEVANGGATGVNHSTFSADTHFIGLRVKAILDVFPEGDELIYEYAWEGAGHNNEYTNFFGRTGINSYPLYEVNRLKVFVDGSEAESAILGQNYNFDENGEIKFGDTTAALSYFGVEKPMYAYNLLEDTVKFANPIEEGTIVKLSYENYTDKEERDKGLSTYLIKIPEDRDVPAIWSDVHRVAKGIYRFVVRESDVLKPWDYHVSAIIPQIDSPACINPVEQLSITQDKTVIFNFPTPLASQRFIYNDSEADIICIASAGSSTQGGIIKTKSTKYDLDSMQHSGYRNRVNDINYPAVEDTTSDTTILNTRQFGVDVNGVPTDIASGHEVSVSSNGDFLNYRREYYWHNVKQGPRGITTGVRTGADAVDTEENSTSRTYLGMQSTKPFGNGMRIFIHCRGGSIRPQYTDFTPRDQVDASTNTFDA